MDYKKFEILVEEMDAEQANDFHSYILDYLFKHNAEKYSVEISDTNDAEILGELDAQGNIDDLAWKAAFEKLDLKSHPEPYIPTFKCGNCANILAVKEGDTCEECGMMICGKCGKYCRYHKEQEKI